MSTLGWEVTEDGALVLRFPAPKPPLSINRAHTMHWGARRAETDPWRDMAIVLVRQALRVTGWPGRGLPVTIRMELPFRTATRRDPHNYVGTVVKATVDGLTTGGLIPDDSQEWATILEPTLVVQRDKSEPLTARVIITPRRAPHG